MNFYMWIFFLNLYDKYYELNIFKCGFVFLSDFLYFYFIRDFLKYYSGDNDFV